MKEGIFEIRVLAEAKQYRIIARSDTGEERESVANPPKGLKEDVIELQTAILRSSGVRGSQVAAELGHRADDRLTLDFGAKIFSFLFSGDIASFYRTSLLKAKEAKRLPLRLKLRIDEGARELSTVPWEALYDSRSRSFLSTSLNALFTRTVDVSDTPILKPKCLHILGMISSPSEFRGRTLDRIESDMERAKITQALEPLEDSKKAQLSWTASGGFRDFRRRLRSPDDKDEGWTIFHFIGHGDFDEQNQLGFLIFEGVGSPEGDSVYADALTPMLTQPGGPQLVVLNACNGAHSDTGDLFSSTAARLALGGVPAVVAMQFPVSDQMAIAFAQAFYELLADGYSIHQALAQTRIDLQHRKFAEWISPVLFLCSSDGQLLTM